MPSVDYVFCCCYVAASRQLIRSTFYSFRIFIYLFGIIFFISSRFAKIWNGGISFTSERSGLVYLVDPAGTRSTKDIFSDLLASDFSKQTFFHGSQHGGKYLEECVKILSSAHYKLKADGSEVWIINDILIQKTMDNLVR